MKEAAETMKTLAAQKWEWSAEAVQRILRGLTWEFVRNVQHRDEYRLHNGWVASVYHERGVPFLVEVDVHAYVEVDSLNELEYQRKADEFYDKYRAAVGAAREVLGNPLFDGETAATGFPQDQDAVWLALWRSEDARYMIQQKHEDRETPFRICLVVAPRER